MESRAFCRFTLLVSALLVAWLEEHIHLCHGLRSSYSHLVAVFCQFALAGHQQGLMRKWVYTP